jgi:hypothetical protein
LPFFKNDGFSDAKKQKNKPQITPIITEKIICGNRGVICGQ